MASSAPISHTNSKSLNDLEAVIYWFSSPNRLGFYALSQCVRALFTPLIQLALGILVKRAFGLNTENTPSSTSQIVLLRRYINSILLSPQRLHQALSILGTHYEMVTVSFILRIVGQLMNCSYRLYTGQWALKSDNVSTGRVPGYIALIPNCWRLAMTLFLVINHF